MRQTAKRTEPCSPACALLRCYGLVMLCPLHRAQFFTGAQEATRYHDLPPNNNGAPILAPMNIAGILHAPRTPLTTSHLTPYPAHPHLEHSTGCFAAHVSLLGHGAPATPRLQRVDGCLGGREHVQDEHHG
eukprot:1863856-Prymnesium_polylepis.1